VIVKVIQLLQVFSSVIFCTALQHFNCDPAAVTEHLVLRLLTMVQSKPEFETVL